MGPIYPGEQTVVMPASGYPGYVVLKVPGSGILRALRVVQTVGTKAGFSYSLLSKKVAADGTLTGDQIEPYRLLPTITFAVNPAAAAVPTLEIAYGNLDNGPLHPDKTSCLYLVLTSVSTYVGKTYVITSVVEKPLS